MFVFITNEIKTTSSQAKTALASRRCLFLLPKSLDLEPRTRDARLILTTYQHDFWPRFFSLFLRFQSCEEVELPNAYHQI